MKLARTFEPHPGRGGGSTQFEECEKRTLLCDSNWWLGKCSGLARVAALLICLLFDRLGLAQTYTVLKHCTTSGGASSSEPARASEPIPWSEIGTKATAQYAGEGLSISAVEGGAVLRCVFQRMNARATAEGLWITSTVDGAKGEPFRVVAGAVGREVGSEHAQPCPREPQPRDSQTRLSALRALPATGTVEVAEKLARFVRPGVVEEYSASMDGVRQDFVISEKPDASGELRVELDVSGARAEAAPHGARLLLKGSGRKIAYSRLRVTDATGKELTARMEVQADGARRLRRLDAEETVWTGNFLEALESPTLMRSEDRAPALALLVNDAGAVYPVRIDPTFSDENCISMRGLPGADSDVYAAVVDGSGNLYIGGQFIVAGNVIANRIANGTGAVGRRWVSERLRMGDKSRVAQSIGRVERDGQRELERLESRLEQVYESNNGEVEV